MKFVPPVQIADAALVASSLPETDYAEWSAAATYAAGDRVIKAATHRVYESAAGANKGNDPAAVGSAAWTDMGPTNRWAMFVPTAGMASIAAGALSVTVAPGAAIDTLALLDTVAATARVQVSVGGAVAFDQTYPVVDAVVTLEGLPAPAGAQITVTADGFATNSVGALLLGTAVDLGVTETNPTIGITDYSKRTTDDYGVTTVVERAWAKTLSTNVQVATSRVDLLQRTIAAVRAEPVLWIAEQSYAVLTLFGFFSDFSLDLQLNDYSICSLTIQGLPSAPTTLHDVDPSPSDTAGSLKVIRPEVVSQARLISINVPENDYPEWDAGATYGNGARVIKASMHRVYESVVGGNVGNDPVSPTNTKWTDVGPTNRWAMFDQALGSVTTATGAIVLTLNPATTITALAVLDTNAASVRVQAPGYDRTVAVAEERAVFLDLDVVAGGQFTVTIAATGGAAAVEAGTLLMGALSPLGAPAISPKVGITDYSKKDTDDFGLTTVVERAWAKRMEVSALISTDAADSVLRRIASIRGMPSLWIASDDLSALTIYGFFRDFSIQLAENASTFALTVEGLSTAAPVQPLATVSDVTWPTLPDPDGTKPANNATVGAPAGTYIGDTLAEDVVAQVRALQQQTGGGDATPPGAPTGLVATSTLLADGTVDLGFTWDANPETDIAYYIFSLALNGGGAVQSVAPANSTVFHGIQPNAAFVAKVAAVDKSTNKSTFSAAISGNTIKDTLPPAPPTNFTAIGSFKAISFTWTNPGDSDLAAIRLLYSASPDPATATGYGTEATGVPGTVGRRTVSGLDTGFAGYWWVSAIDTSGNASVLTGPVYAATIVNNTSDLADNIITQAKLGPLSVYTGAIQAQAVIASKVAVVAENLFPDSQINDPTWWFGPSPAAVAPFATPGYQDNPGAWIVNPDTGFSATLGAPRHWLLYSQLGNTSSTSNYTFCTPGIAGVSAAQTYAVAIGMENFSNVQANVDLQWINADGSITIGTNIVSMAPGTGAQIVKKQVTAPSTPVIGYRFAFYVIHNGSPFNGYVRLGETDLRKANGAELVVDGTISAQKIIFNQGFADAFFANTLTVSSTFAAKLIQSVDNLPGYLTISGTGFNLGTLTQTAQTAYNNAADPAGVIRAQGTYIGVGNVLTQGGNPISNWVFGGDSASLNGGAIAANTITLNKAVIGLRGVQLIDITFDTDRVSTVYWSAGYVEWQDDAGNRRVDYMRAGSQTFDVNNPVAVLLVWFDRAASPNAFGDGSGHLWAGMPAGGVAEIVGNTNNVILALYRNGTNLDASYGRTIIDGDYLKTGTLDAQRVIVHGTITTDLLGARIVTADKIGVGELSAITANIGLLRTATSGQRMELDGNNIRSYDGNNVLRFRAGVW
ncbi:fibronectin type III domain-containing protein [Sphingomonas nostoxanthinifaciens]|uniref:hypothetical protein n=1 Tax=Sphingomonas nostoxanthinifaciens TaxID=2872652 RepID=UPI001CC1F249|nr:hypothetical protein [Sphingomonas nostoxanthinifaciens]UAK25868.1 hypothetical protein K8P63_07035 [Sphingomonas nostoxanthinifaciens]